VELILIRHARPIREERGDGQAADPPLSAAGRAQADAVARWLLRAPPQKLVSSPALRARQTAEPAAGAMGLELIVDDRLRDAHPDRERYVPMEEEKREDPTAYRARMKAYAARRADEASAERVYHALDDWVERSPGERVAVFCHGSVVNLFAARVLGLATPFFLEADYASAHRFMISRAGIHSVRSLNETAFLE
jgi:probable phosphoglycerate mutase